LIAETASIRITRCPDESGRYDWRRIFRVAPGAIRHGLAFTIWPELKDRAWSVVDGEWDRNVKPVESDIRHRGVYEFLRDGLPFRKTALFRHESKIFERGEACRGCSTAREYARSRSWFVRTLYDDLMSTGRLRSNLRFVADEGEAARTAEICVAVARDGRPILCTGWHRTSVARLVGIDWIPVRVVLRHREWVASGERNRNAGDLGLVDAADLPLW